jgi:RNA 3'-terminal phosphate cyclase
LLPVAAPAGSQTSAALVASASVLTTPDIVKVYSQAKARETLADVARRSAMALSQVAQWNGIAPKRVNQRLSTGKVLTLWVQRERAGGFLSALPAMGKTAAKTAPKARLGLAAKAAKVPKPVISGQKRLP